MRSKASLQEASWRAAILAKGRELALAQAELAAMEHQRSEAVAALARSSEGRRELEGSVSSAEAAVSGLAEQLGALDQVSAAGATAAKAARSDGGEAALVGLREEIAELRTAQQQCAAATASAAAAAAASNALLLAEMTGLQHRLQQEVVARDRAVAKLQQAKTLFVKRHAKVSLACSLVLIVLLLVFTNCQSRACWLPTFRSAYVPGCLCACMSVCLCVCVLLKQADAGCLGGC